MTKKPTRRAQDEEAGLQIKKPTHLQTYDEFGLKARMVGSAIEVTVFDHRGKDAFEEKIMINIRQAKQIGKWLVKRAKEDKGPKVNHEERIERFRASAGLKR